VAGRQSREEVKRLKKMRKMRLVLGDDSDDEGSSFGRTSVCLSSKHIPMIPIADCVEASDESLCDSDSETSQPSSGESSQKQGNKTKGLILSVFDKPIDYIYYIASLIFSQQK
jgi:hypothetical protein